MANATLESSHEPISADAYRRIAAGLPAAVVRRFGSRNGDAARLDTQRAEPPNGNIAWDAGRDPRRAGPPGEQAQYRRSEPGSQDARDRSKGFRAHKGSVPGCGDRARVSGEISRFRSGALRALVRSRRFCRRQRVRYVLFAAAGLVLLVPRSVLFGV